MYPEVPDTVCQTNTKILVPQQSHLSACCSDARVSYNLLKLQRTIEKTTTTFSGSRYCRPASAGTFQYHMNKTRSNHPVWASEGRDIAYIHKNTDKHSSASIPLARVRSSDM